MKIRMSLLGMIAILLLAGGCASNDQDRQPIDSLAADGAEFRRGASVMPAALAATGLTPAQTQALDAARRRLVTALDGGGRRQEPDLSAFVAKQFDCWQAQAQESDDPDAGGDCRDPFLLALEILEYKLDGGRSDKAAETAAVAEAAPAVERPRTFTLYFLLDSIKMTAATKDVMRALAQDARQDNGRIEVVGHADLTGTSPYNMRLSQNRAAEVRRILTEFAAISFDRFLLDAKGDTEPLVPTRRGVPLEANRRAVVTLH